MCPPRRRSLPGPSRRSLRQARRLRLPSHHPRRLTPPRLRRCRRRLPTRVLRRLSEVVRSALQPSLAAGGEHKW